MTINKEITINKFVDGLVKEYKDSDELYAEKRIREQLLKYIGLMDFDYITD